jgi:hypothetical protein
LKLFDESAYKTGSRTKREVKDPKSKTLTKSSQRTTYTPDGVHVSRNTFVLFGVLRILPIRQYDGQAFDK